ncbi:sugar ABC transporter permease [Candidatus Aerophobetes bacterium]|nr:sugar ABC transporter permease [Candidatus Aerophobetes bacterium]
MRRFFSPRWGKTLKPYLYVSHTLIGLLIFVFGPVAIAFLLSFTKWDLIRAPVWIGWNNYKDILNSTLFWKVIKNTFYFTLVSVSLGIIVSLSLAIMVNQKLRGISFFRLIYFLPVVAPMVAVSLVWKWLYNVNFGLINYFLNLIGIQGPNWLNDTRWAMPAIIVMSIWKMAGYNMIIFLAGLQNIPVELYEAASIDGANRWRQFWCLTIPLLSPTIFFALIILFISSFQVFEQTFVMTGGGPYYTTLTLPLYIYQKSFLWFQIGYGAALSFIFFIIVLIVILIQFGLENKWVFYR